ncbi:CBS domain-containing protein [Bradyrhizobium valentinum]|uniref:Inosine-5-monophosphate dehydrogenase n=1 Tax=Bradyrhizobium valentinum TaxID=1518501 RepID=A0A0R3KUB0_9BRAD|nr:CBS domain-containing protein [Bradyrhizobium valentinum]KRQ99120.1 inosine-5-monophosphate dehydrogenase [Bradyrhizobium valentinum]KRR04564.1 inosine-5-monophosphate dehydrogenase [Bradyrhizobium valentinum]
MKIREVMTRDTKLATPDDTLRHAAKLMKECDCGILPVAEDDRLVGMITDRDIAVRCVAEGKGPNAKVREAMTEEVKYCFEDEIVSHVCENMSEIQVRRLPVLDRNKRLVGIVSLGDLASKAPGTARALRGIAQPSMQHNQSSAAA